MSDGWLPCLLMSMPIERLPESIDTVSGPIRRRASRMNRSSPRTSACTVLTPLARALSSNGRSQLGSRHLGAARRPPPVLLDRRSPRPGHREWPLPRRSSGAKREAFGRSVDPEAVLRSRPLPSVKPWNRWNRLVRVQRASMARTASVSDTAGRRTVTSLTQRDAGARRLNRHDSRHIIGSMGHDDRHSQDPISAQVGWGLS